MNNKILPFVVPRDIFCQDLILDDNCLVHKSNMVYFLVNLNCKDEVSIHCIC